MGSSLKDLRGFPTEVRRAVGQALFSPQQGDKDPAAKPLRGFGAASLLEIVANYRGDTWRTVYTVRYADAVYVVHAFQKKSKRGIGTPQKELEVIRLRLAEIERIRRSSQN